MDFARWPQVLKSSRWKTKYSDMENSKAFERGTNGLIHATLHRVQVSHASPLEIFNQAHGPAQKKQTQRIPLILWCGGKNRHLLVELQLDIQLSSLPAYLSDKVMRLYSKFLCNRRLS